MLFRSGNCVQCLYFFILRLHTCLSDHLVCPILILLAEGEGRNVGNESKIVLTFFLSDKKCSKIHCVDGCTYL